MTTQNKFLSTLAGKNDNNIPAIWFMRQAGRYLPEYRQIRSNVKSFMELCRNVDLATKITLQPIQRFNFDAAIIFSDILVIPHAMGMNLEFIESNGPVFDKPIRSLADVNQLLDVDHALRQLDFVSNIIKNVRQELSQSKAVIGFCGSPFTIACYMLEGKSQKNNQHNFQNMFHWIKNQPQDLIVLLEKLSITLSAYLIAQIEAGADALMIFDTWGGILTQEDYKAFSFEFINNIINIVKNIYPTIPIIAFSKTIPNATHEQIYNMHKLFNNSNCEAIGVDYNIDINIAVNNLSSKIIQGNLNPTILANGSLKEIEFASKHILDTIANSNHAARFIFNLGHGILPNTDINHVHHLIDFVRNYHNVK